MSTRSSVSVTRGLLSYVNPYPLMYQRAAATFRIVATPFAASVRVPVVPAGDKTMTSVVIGIVTVLISLTKWMMVPMGYATAEFAGIVNARATLSAVGCKIVFPRSANTSV